MLMPPAMFCRLICSPLIFLLLLISAHIRPAICYPQQFTFELEDGDERCFHARLKQQKYVLTYQVVYGGQLDVDIKVFGPENEIIAEAQRATHDDVYIQARQNASYTFCFGNAFSAMTHKRVYFELRPENYESLSDEAGEESHQTSLTRAEDSIERSHLALSRAESLQVEFKNREFGDRMVAEDLNTAVLVWSCAVTFAILVTSFGQVTILKNFFADRKTPHRMVRP